jgi:hypothetical protein
MFAHDIAAIMELNKNVLRQFIENMTDMGNKRRDKRLLDYL